MTGRAGAAEGSRSAVRTSQRAPATPGLRRAPGGAQRTSAGCEKYSVWLNVPFTGTTAAAVSATHAGSCGGPVSGAGAVVGAGVVDGAAVLAPAAAHQVPALTYMLCKWKCMSRLVLAPTDTGPGDVFNGKLAAFCCTSSKAERP